MSREVIWPSAVIYGFAVSLGRFATVSGGLRPRHWGGEGVRLEEIRVYQLSMDIGERVWGIVSNWDYFAKDTVGKQWVRAMDSLAANLSEGFGRYHY